MHIEMNLEDLIGDNTRDHKALISLAVSFNALIANAAAFERLETLRKNQEDDDISTTDSAYFFRVALGHLHEVADKLKDFSKKPSTNGFSMMLKQLTQWGTVNDLITDDNLMDFLKEYRNITFHAGFRGDPPPTVTALFGNHQGGTRFLSTERAIKDTVTSVCSIDEPKWNELSNKAAALRSAVIGLIGELLVHLYETRQHAFSPSN